MLVSVCNGGLGNRIKSFSGALRIDPNATVKWPDELDFLQRPAHTAIEPFDTLFARSDRIETKERGKTPMYHSWKWYVREDLGEEECDYKYQDMDRKVVEIYKPIFKEHLQPHPRIIEEAERRLERLDGEIGCFLRTGIYLKQKNSHFSSKENPGKMPVEGFDRVEKEWIRGRKIYLCGDDPCVYNYFSEKPNVTIYKQKNHVYSGWDDAFVNAIVMSRLPHIILTRFSTFSEIIYAYGGFNQDTKIEIFNWSRKLMRKEEYNQRPIKMM